MLAGGVSRPESLFTQAGFTQLKALSPSGTCAPFDADADGLVVGEGAGFIALKRLDDAIRDNDRIYALIHGSGLTNDIGGNLLAPDTEGQVRAMSLAYKDAGWSPFDVDHIECHGTGTPVGDGIELKSMKAVWGDSGWTKGQCAIGSVKSMIGHLLTGAGIAGAIKTFLALHHKTLPPSLNFKKPGNGSPLENGPFRIETTATEWKRRKENPRRAALSAFGFGGINAHVLVEDFEKNVSASYVVPADIGATVLPGVAVVGMGSYMGPSRNLEDFQNSIFSGIPFEKKPAGELRFRGTEKIAALHLNDQSIPLGSYINDFTVSMGEFHIPPNEIPDILPQHLLMLKAAGEALDNAGISRREDRPRMGAAIGMAFDYEAANFHLRWNLEQKVEEWNEAYSLNLDADAKKQWLESLKESVHPPLTASRTTGALGGIIASRVAKEFRLGGPCFIVSCEEASGLKALEIGARSIQNGETDLYLVGSVDLPGEIRSLLITEKTTGHAPAPCEGSVAVVLKRLDLAEKDKDRIYAVVRGIGNASGGGIDDTSVSEDALFSSLERVFDDGASTPDNLAFVETAEPAGPLEGSKEHATLEVFIAERLKNRRAKERPFLGSATHITGYAGASQGLVSFMKSCLCLYQGCSAPEISRTKSTLFSPTSRPVPIHTLNHPANALVSSVTQDGNVCHVLLEQYKTRTETGFLSVAPRIAPHHGRTGHTIPVIVGGKILAAPSLPLGIKEIISRQNDWSSLDVPSENITVRNPAITFDEPESHSEASRLIRQVIRNYALTNAQTAQTHHAFLDFSGAMAKTFADTLKYQADLMALCDGPVGSGPVLSLFDSFHHGEENHQAAMVPEPGIHPVVPAEKKIPLAPVSARPEPAFSREMCMEFAIGSIGKMLGPMFDVVDTYKVRVRLPDEPLMLVDRIMSVEGEKGSLKSGKVVTEHDVFPGAWYLDGGRCPVCISIEAGQADLFLCSYLGIDLAVKGKRSYRLLDAVAKFHGGLPRPGDTIRYEIEIDRFINQGETYLFFFHFNGFIGDRHIISMRKGCAGFFTEKEVKDSGGIILTAEETAKVPGLLTPAWKDLVPFFGTGETLSLSDEQVNALRKGDLGTAFGGVFNGKVLSPSLVIPGGRMKLVDRVLEIDPAGGRYGLGSIKAQADIHPDDWFLTCHFVDDKVMPGTLMYECCMHTLRILTMRMGWVTDQTGVCCEPVPEIASVLKCRGPVTVETKHVFYVVDIKEIGYMPEPYVIADAHMYAHDQHIVMFRDMSMKLSGTTQNDIERYWGK
jgi:3-oxoacyl-(acyl-carrier-protein) synthase/3-hydroxymyristoyl/3-hydroxydecanoyl-(acyl carrier protein) dehydratase